MSTNGPALFRSLETNTLSASNTNGGNGVFSSLVVGDPAPFDPNVYPTAATDAFQRVRVSEIETIIDVQSQYDKQPLIFNEAVANGGALTHDPDASSVLMTTTSTTGSLALRQTKRYLPYQPGKSQIILVTFTLAALQAGLVQEIGYGDDEDGIFLRTEGTALTLVQRSSTSGAVVNEAIAQADWNTDAFDGSGPSSITLDPTKSQILVIDLEWLGVGLVRVGFNIHGRTFYAHGFPHANLEPNVYMATANLPVRWKIENTGGAGAATLRAICCTVGSEAGFENTRAFPFTTSTPVAGIGSVTNASPVPLLAIRPALTFNGKTNRINPKLTEFQAIAFNAPVVVTLLYNPVITGGTWDAVDGNSTIEANSTVASFSGGTAVKTLVIPAEAGGGNRVPGSAVGGLFSELTLALDIAGTQADTLLLTAQRIGPNGTATVFASLAWDEQR